MQWYLTSHKQQNTITNYSFKAISFNHLQQTNPHNLKNNAEMITIGSSIDKRLQQLNNMTIILIEYIFAFLNLKSLEFSQRLIKYLW